jgi:hypothetical protein
MFMLVEKAVPHGPTGPATPGPPDQSVCPAVLASTSTGMANRRNTRGIQYFTMPPLSERVFKQHKNLIIYMPMRSTVSIHEATSERGFRGV